jgi:hypothetical protein
METLIGVWAAGTVIVWSGMLLVIGTISWCKDKWF